MWREDTSGKVPSVGVVLEVPLKLTGNTRVCVREINRSNIISSLTRFTIIIMMIDDGWWEWLMDWWIAGWLEVLWLMVMMIVDACRFKRPIYSYFVNYWLLRNYWLAPDDAELRMLCSCESLSVLPSYTNFLLLSVDSVAYIPCERSMAWTRVLFLFSLS